MNLLKSDKWNETYRETQPHEEILGIILMKCSLFKEIKNRLSPDDFNEYEWLYKLMREVDEQEGLTYKGIGMRLETNQLRILHGFRQTFISENRLPELIKKIKLKKLSNRLHSIGNRLIEEVEPENANEFLSELQHQSFELFTTDTEDLIDMDREVESFGKWVEEIMADPSKAFGLMTGIKDIDTITTGYHRGDLIVVGAWTSMGKSAFMIENVLRLHKAGYKCAVFSLEMSRKQIYLRMIANLMGAYLETLRTGMLAAELLPKFHEAKKSLRGIYVDDTRGIDSEYISDICRRLKRTQGLDFVVVDYLQDVKEKGESNDNQGSALGRVCRKLRTTAQQMNVPVMGLSQVGREVQKRQDKHPTNADLSGSTGIETSADVIALLYRDEYYDPTPGNKGILEVNFTKQRNGKLGKVELFYDKDTQRIQPISRR